VGLVGLLGVSKSGVIGVLVEDSIVGFVYGLKVSSFRVSTGGFIVWGFNVYGGVHTVCLFGVSSGVCLVGVLVVSNCVGVVGAFSVMGYGV
jgi:hypothetical protein